MSDKGFCIVGEENVRNVRILALRSALKLEVNTGLKMSRGISPFAIIKREFGFKGNKARVLEQLAISGDQHAMVRVINALLDDDYGVSEAAYSAMKDAGMVPTDIANRVKATDGRFYLSSVSRDELERDFHE